jgi:crotonobetainyl-CoA:carnitine CoA-transferase CaiB-like acyl-CoA transferase
MVDLLDGIRVVDFTHVHAGPLCTYQLGLMGAEVVKVESPVGGDQMRGMGAAGGAPSMSPGFVGQSANKRCVALDLKHPDGLAVARELIGTADVLVHNMRPGTMERLGLGVEAVRGINEQIVYCAISGYGQAGPKSARPALDHLMQGESGMFDATGMPDGPAVRVGFAVADASTAVIASSAICAALYRRTRTGSGVFLDVSMLECCLTVMGLNVYGYLGAGRVGPRVGPNPLARLGSVGTFATRTNTLLVNANNYRLFERLADAVGHPELVAQYPREGGFVERWQSLRQRFADVFAGEPADHWEAVLTEAGVPVGQVRHLSEVFDNEQLAYRSAVTDVEGHRHINAGFQVDGAPTAPSRPAEHIGESTVAVLTELGLSEERVESLIERGVVARYDG